MRILVGILLSLAVAFICAILLIALRIALPILLLEDEDIMTLSMILKNVTISPLRMVAATSWFVIPIGAFLGWLMPRIFANRPSEWVIPYGMIIGTGVGTIATRFSVPYCGHIPMSVVVSHGCDRPFFSFAFIIISDFRESSNYHN